MLRDADRQIFQLKDELQRKKRPLEDAERDLRASVLKGSSDTEAVASALVAMVPIGDPAFVPLIEPYALHRDPYLAPSRCGLCAISARRFDERPIS